MRFTLNKAFLLILLLGVIFVLALPFTKSSSLAFLRDSEPGIKLSTAMRQPLSDEALSSVAQKALQKIEAAQEANNSGGEEYELELPNLDALEDNIAMLGDQQKPELVEKNHA